MFILAQNAFNSAENTPDLSEMRDTFAHLRACSHPAALEAAGEMNSQATGLRPQCTDRQPVPTRPVRLPSHNARISGFLAFRQAASSVLGPVSPVAEPRRLVFRSLLGVRQAADGFALNLEFAYHSERGVSYIVTGFTTGGEAGRLSGSGWARACTCPDFQKRRGPGRDQLHGEARCCMPSALLRISICACCWPSWKAGRAKRPGWTARRQRISLPARRSA